MMKRICLLLYCLFSFGQYCLNVCGQDVLIEHVVLPEQVQNPRIPAPAFEAYIENDTLYILSYNSSCFMVSISGAESVEMSCCYSFEEGESPNCYLDIHQLPAGEYVIQIITDNQYIYEGVFNIENDFEEE